MQPVSVQAPEAASGGEEALFLCWIDLFCRPLPPPQEVFDALATVADMISVQSEVDMIVDLLKTAHQPRWFRRLFVHRSRKTI